MAGTALSAEINLYRRNHPDAVVNVVAHSDGGNVAFIASQSAPIDTLVTLGTPILRRFRPDPQNVGLHINGYSSGDLVQTPFSYDWHSLDFPQQTLSSAINVRIPQPDDIVPNAYPHMELINSSSWKKIDSVYQSQP